MRKMKKKLREGKDIVTVNNAQALNVYYKHCKDFGYTPEEGIDSLPPNEIFIKCFQVYERHVKEQENVKNVLV